MDIRLIALICVVLANVNAKKNRKPSSGSRPNPGLEELEEEVTKFLVQDYADIFTNGDLHTQLEGIRDSWAEDGELVITVNGMHPFYGQIEMVDHFDKVFRDVAFTEVLTEVTGYGPIADTKGQVAWATSATVMYGYEKGGLEEVELLANLTAAWIFRRNICDGKFRIQTQGCGVNYVADWLVKYLQ